MENEQPFMNSLPNISLIPRRDRPYPDQGMFPAQEEICATVSDFFLAECYSNLQDSPLLILQGVLFVVERVIKRF